MSIIDELNSARAASELGYGPDFRAGSGRTRKVKGRTYVLEAVMPKHYRPSGYARKMGDRQWRTSPNAYVEVRYVVQPATPSQMAWPELDQYRGWDERRPTDRMMGDIWDRRPHLIWRLEA